MSYLSQQIKKLCDAGLHLVEIPPINGKPTKAPKKKGWNQLKSKDNTNGYSNNPDDFKDCDGSNFGLYHGTSNTVAFDIDNRELTCKLFEDVADIKITDWLNDNLRFEIKNPKPNRDKLLYKLPPEFSGDLKQLKHKKEMIFELRYGNCQDVIYGQHPEGGDYQIIGNPQSIPEAPAIILDMLSHWEDWKPVFDSALCIDQDPPKYKPHIAQQGENIKGWRNPITEFNQSYSCAGVLMRNGYKRVGKDRLIRPNSSSRAPAVLFCRNCADGRERVRSWGGDALSDGYAHDAFDCMRLLEYEGDLSKALNWNADISKHNQILYMQNKSEQVNIGDFNASTHNEILDNSNNYQNVDLLQHLPEGCLIKNMCRFVATQTNLPESTVLLAGLSVYSSVAARDSYVSYQNGQALPIGLYSVLEQPSGTGKTRCLDYFQRPFNNQLKIFSEEISSNILELERSLNKTDAIKEEIAKLKDARKRLVLFITNATPEGLEKTLATSCGYFSAASSEQGLFNSLLGNSYNTGANNNDIVLNGFDGGYVASTRATREGYVGPVIGGICCFAQYGSIETLLSASNGTGLSERFLKLTENHTLGTRDHLKETTSYNDDNVLADYEKLCVFVKGVLENPMPLKSLGDISICSQGHILINTYRNKIERYLADGGKYSHISMRGAASKVNMQIMKIAANLFLLDGGVSFLESIPLPIIQSSINIANDLLEANLKLCMAKDIIGTRAEFTSILSLFEKDSRPRSERRIITSKVSTQPFKEMTGNKSDKIRETLEEMVLAKLLLITFEASGAKLYSLSQ